MAAKPGTLPRWADVGGAIVVPGAGKLDVGYVPGERPPAQYENWHKNLVYQWMQYLSDGALVGAHSISGLLTASAGITVPTGQNVTLAGTADLKHGDRTLVVSPAGGSFGANVSYDVTNAYAVTTGSSASAYPIPLRVGDRIKSLTFLRYGNAGAYSNVFAMFKRDSSGTLSIPATYTVTYTTPTTAAWRTDTYTPASPVAIAAGEVWWLEWQTNPTATRFGGVHVVYDRP